MSLIPCRDISGLRNPKLTTKSTNATSRPLSIRPVQSIPFDVGTAGASDDIDFHLSILNWTISKT